MKSTSAEIFEFLLWVAVFAVIGFVIISCFTYDWQKPEPPVVETTNKELTRAHQLIENIFDVKIDKTFSSYSIPVTASAYTAREEECNENPEVTADMTPSRVGLLAVSRDLIQDMGLKFGDTVMLLDHGEFLGAFVIHDVMNARFTNRVDILHSLVKSARLFGVKRGVLLIRVVGDEA